MNGKVTMEIPTEYDFDQLCLNICEFTGFKSGSIVPYDTVGYERVQRIQQEIGTLKSKDWPLDEGVEVPKQALFTSDSYLTRIMGFQRRSLFSPDGIGSLIKERSIVWNDGLGNGLYESLRIDRKYGLKHVFEAPMFGFDLPYLPSEWPRFKEIYNKKVKEFQNDLKELELIYGGPLAYSGDRLIILGCPNYPLSLFAEACQRNPRELESDLLNEIGCSEIPFQPKNTNERATLVKFLALTRERQAKILEYQAKILRKILGPDLKIVSNPHELPWIDYENYGQIYDSPSVGIRPLLIDDDVMLRHYVPYFVQLFHDLTGKSPVVSIRVNLSAATARFVPKKNLIKHWFNQSVQHGASSFYFWTRDFPSSDNPNSYDGPIPGNPDPSALGIERWHSMIDCMGILSKKKRFVPPKAEVGILIPEESALLTREEWRRIYATFSGFSEAKIQTMFISDRKIGSIGVPRNIRLLIIPVLEFVSSTLKSKLDEYAANSGKILIGNHRLFDQSGKLQTSIFGSTQFNPSIMDVFPVNKKSFLRNLIIFSKYLSSETKKAGVNTHSWIFDLTCDMLPDSDELVLRAAQPSLNFSPWQYEQSSSWIMPYLNFSE